MAEQIVLHLGVRHGSDALLDHHHQIQPGRELIQVPPEHLADQSPDAVPKNRPADLLGDGDPEATRSAASW
jgi:hypothetical protein